MTERKVLFEPDTPVSVIMEALYDDLTDEDRGEIAEVEAMSDQEIEVEARAIRARLGIPEPS